MMSALNYEELIKKYEKMELQELQMLQKKIVNALYKMEETKKLGVVTSVSDQVYLRNCNELMLLTGVLFKKYDVWQSGFSNEELFEEDCYFSSEKCPRCGTKSKKRYCPVCGFNHLF